MTCRYGALISHSSAQPVICRGHATILLGNMCYARFCMNLGGQCHPDMIAHDAARSYHSTRRNTVLPCLRMASQERGSVFAAFIPSIPPISAPPVPQGVRDWRVPDDRRMAAPVIQRRASTGSSEASMSRQGSAESGRRESHRVRIAAVCDDVTSDLRLADRRCYSYLLRHKRVTCMC